MRPTLLRAPRVTKAPAHPGGRPIIPIGANLKALGVNPLVGSAQFGYHRFISTNSTVISPAQTERFRMPLLGPTKSLAEFLEEQRSQYLKDVGEGKGREWIVAMGNEAGDLDSLASAIAYAWYATTIEQRPTVALIQTLRSDLHLRAENLHALALAGIDNLDSKLLCIDDIPSTTPFPSNKFALVDHNHLHPRFAHENSDAQVVAIIDHHDDEGLHKDTADPRIIVVPAGSASSLVAQFIERKCQDKIPPELATLLLCAILVDTNGLKVGGKAEEVDRAAASFLASRSLFSPDISSLNTSALHEDSNIQELSSTLQTKKASVSHLDTRDLLRRDYKEYTFTPSWAPNQTIHVGLSSVPVGLKTWIPRDEAFWSSTEKWMSERELDILGVLTSFQAVKKLKKNGHPKHKRQQLFIVRIGEGQVEGLADRLFEGLEASKELGLKRRDFSKHYGVKKGVGFSRQLRAAVWKQKNIDATRKVTAPLVKRIIEGTSGPNSASL